MARKWSYWTRNKLQILGEYAPSFNRASQKARDRLYLDLMAGQPDNEERLTGEIIDGSARRVLAADPGFTRHVFFELPPNAARLDAVLRAEFPDKVFEVVAGDSNRTIDRELAKLRPYNNAPTFAFIDQQAAEVWWDTLVKIAKFKGENPYTKPEIWLLMSPAMTRKGVSSRGTNSAEFRERVTRLYGTRNWLNIQDAREASLIDAEQYRDEMTNLMRFRLAQDLGYRYTHRIPMKMTNGTTIYDMVFATDHYAGDKIMRHLYAEAAKREPRMRREAQRLEKLEREQRSGIEGLFDLPESAIPEVSGAILWQPEDHWNPADRPWWSERD